MITFSLICVATIFSYCGFFWGGREHDIKVQSTPDNSDLLGKLKKVQVIGSWEQMTGKKEKTGLLCISVQRSRVKMEQHF